MEELILQVKGSNEQKRVSIPKNSKIKVGDYILVKKLDRTERRLKNK